MMPFHLLRCKLVVRRQILAREKTIELESMIETYVVATYSRAYISKKREIILFIFAFSVLARKSD